MMKRQEAAVESAPIEPESAQTNPRWLPLLLVVAGAVVYLNSFDGVFLMDDDTYIVQNERIRQLWSPGELLSGRRPLVDLTLALNFARHGFEVSEYHAVNLLVHVLAAMTLYGVVRRTAVQRVLPEEGERSAAWLALAVALIWLVHPLLTQSVTYIIQRSESLMGLFYLLTLYCVIRGDQARHSAGWYGAAVGCCALGAASKAVIVTAPLIVLLYDRRFMAPSWGELVRRRWGLYLGLAIAAVGVLLATGVAWGVLNPEFRPQTNVGFGYKGVTPWEYLKTQPGVILRYLRLSVWPDPLCFHYEWPVAEGWAFLLPFLAVLALIGGTVVALFRVPWLGFTLAWTLVILIPTSSFIPIRDLAFEHRMYLSLAGVVVVFVGSGHALLLFLSQQAGVWFSLRRLVAVIAVVGIAMVLGLQTIHRNATYHSTFAMWSDVAEQRPKNFLAQCALGKAYRDQDNNEMAIAHYRESLRLKPDYDRAHYNLGLTLYAEGEKSEAIEHYQKANELNPEWVQPLYSLGVAFDERGDAEQARAYYAEAVRVDPRHAKAHTNLGTQLYRVDRIDEAIEVLLRARELDPGDPLAHYNLGLAFHRKGRVDEAIASFEVALRLNAGNKQLAMAAQQNLGNALMGQGRLEEAKRAYQAAIRAEPNYHAAHYRLGVVFAQQGEAKQAEIQFRLALQLKPDYAPAQEALNSLRGQ